MAYTPRFPILLKLGLSDGEAEIFELLVQYGTQKARDLVEKSTQSRGNVYNLLTSLITKHLVLEISGKQKQYQAVDPSRLKTLLDTKKEAVSRLEAEFNSSLSGLSSLFNLSTGKPAIQYFEGLEGLEEALNDSLTATTEILTYIDPEYITGDVAAVNTQYVKRRRAKGIHKRIILPDNEHAHAYLNQMGGSFTDALLAKQLATGFATAMEVYDDKVSFLTLTPEKIIAVIIQDKNIANLQRAQFEYVWRTEEARQAASGNSSAGSLESTSSSNAT